MVDGDNTGDGKTPSILIDRARLQEEDTSTATVKATATVGRTARRGKARLSQRWRL